jgi:hypothetical protein
MVFYLANLRAFASNFILELKLFNLINHLWLKKDSITDINKKTKNEV